METPAEAPIARLTASLKSVAGEEVSAGELADALGEGAHGTLLILLAIPNLIPIPIFPASTTITGIMIAAVGAQLVRAASRPMA